MKKLNQLLIDISNNEQKSREQVLDATKVPLQYKKLKSFDTFNKRLISIYNFNQKRDHALQMRKFYVVL